MKENYSSEKNEWKNEKIKQNISRLVSLFNGISTLCRLF